MSLTQMILEKLHPKVMAFEEGDCTPEIIELVKRHGVRIHVDRLGEQDDPSHWSGAAGFVQAEVVGKLLR